MLGRTPGNIVATRPLRDGVISDYTVTEKMLKYFINKIGGRFLFSPRIMICIPSVVTEVEVPLPTETPTPTTPTDTETPTPEPEQPAAPVYSEGMDDPTSIFGDDANNGDENK